MTRPKDSSALTTIRGLGIVRPSDLAVHGITRGQFYRLVRTALLERISRGTYVAGDHDPTENHCLAMVAKRVPAAVICLLSALRFHDIGTQNPFQVWIALPLKARHPRLDYPKLRLMRASGDAFATGIEVHRIEGADVRVYTPAKTVVDCFKYRHKIGLDVALEAMKEGWRGRRYTMDEICRLGRICRVERVMQPYLEAMVA